MMPTHLAFLASIRIILVETSHPGNIGAAARAMKTMGLSQLILVQPKHFPDAYATAMASSAADLLETAQVLPDLAQAVAGCHLVIGSSARQRASAWPQVDARGAADLLLSAVAADKGKTQVALVFGRESSGLTNEELDLCHYLGHIETNPIYGVLNVAMAVQVFGYEIWTQAQQSSFHTETGLWRRKPATMDELTQLYAHLETTLLEIGYLKPVKNDRIMRRLKRLFHRAQLETKELLIFRGILRSLQRLARLSGEK